MRVNTAVLPLPPLGPNGFSRACPPKVGRQAAMFGGREQTWRWASLLGGWIGFIALAAPLAHAQTTPSSPVHVGQGASTVAPAESRECRPPTAAMASPLLPRIRVSQAGMLAEQDYYYLLLFGSHSRPRNIPDRSHCWATFVHVRAGIPLAGTDGPAPPRLLAARTLSWMPANRKIHTAKLLPQWGANLTLEETLDLMTGPDYQAGVWGPFQITAAAYQTFLKQWCLLEKGGPDHSRLYKAFDFNIEPGFDRITNCIHALSDVVSHTNPGYRGRWHYLEFWRYGEAATEFLVHEAYGAKVICRLAPEANWLFTALGLEQRPLLLRYYDGQGLGRFCKVRSQVVGVLGNAPWPSAREAQYFPSRH